MTCWHDICVRRVVSCLENIKTNGRRFAKAVLGNQEPLVRAEGLTVEKSQRLVMRTLTDERGDPYREWQKLEEDQDVGEDEVVTVQWRGVDETKLLQAVGRCFSQIQVRIMILADPSHSGYRAMCVPSDGHGWVMVSRRSSASPSATRS